MNKVELNTSSPNNTLSNLYQSNTSCTCSGCAICTACIVFAPIVGVALAPSLGVNLVGVRNVY